MQSGKAIPFIVKDATNDTYHLTPQAEALLATITTPISVVTVAGLYRTGKSYLLNRVILNRSGGFGVGPTVNPCTKGLWVWGEPLSVGGRTVLVVDTEGLGALDEESNHDMKIFCLAVLLSSSFIYNSVGSIDEPALQTLSLVLNLIASIDSQAYSHRPSFLWVVRDFALQLINQRGQQITSSQYLQLALNIENQKEPQKIQLRKTITDAFTERECFTLIKPLIDQNKLQSLDRVPAQQLRPEFVSQTITLRKYIMQSLKEMRLGEAALKGGEYILMCKKFLSAINSGAVPDLKDTWGYIKEEKARQVVEHVRETYTERLRMRLNNKFPMPSTRLAELLQHMREQAEQEFLQLSYEETLNGDLLEFLAASETEMNRLNAKESRAALSEILRREFEPFQKKMLSGYYSDSSSYEQDLRSQFRPALQEKYGERLDLPQLEVDLYTERRIVEGVKVFQKRSREEALRIREARVEAESGLQNEIRNLNRIFDEERRRMQEETFELEKKLIIVTNEKQRIQEAFQKTKRDEEAQNGRLRRRAEEGQQQTEGLMKELLRLQSVNAQQERQIFRIKKQFEKQKALSRQKEQHLQNKMSEFERRSNTLLQQSQNSMKAWQNEKRQMTIQAQHKEQQATKDRKEINDHLTEVLGQLEHEKFTTVKLREEVQSLKERHQEQLQRFRQRCTSSAKKDTKAELQGQYLRELQQARQQVERTLQQWRESELKVRQLQQQIKLHKSQAEKQEAIASQRIEFQQMQNQDLRAKVAELNTAYQRLFETAQNNSAQEAELIFKRKVTHLETQHATVVRELEIDCEGKVATAKREIALFIRERDEAQLQLALHARRWQQREKYLMNTVQMLQQEIEQMKRQLSHTEQGHAESQREKEISYTSRIRHLQAQMEEVKRQTTMEIEEMTRRSEETVNFIKQCSDMEKAQFQRRIEEEREKRERKVTETAEEWSQRLSQEKQHLQGVIAELEGSIEAMKGQFSEQMQHMRSDCEIRIQKISNTALEERMQLTQNIALLKQQNEITRKNLSNQLEQRARQYAGATEALKKDLLFECEQQVREASEAMKDLEGRFQTLKKTNRKSEENNLLLKTELDREKAANRQRDQAASRRLKEFQQRLTEQMRNNTLYIEQLNNQHMLETRKLNEQIQRLRNMIVRLETDRTKVDSQYDMQRNNMQTRLNYLQNKLKRSKDDQEDLLKKFETTVRIISNHSQKQDKKRQFQQTIQRMKEEYKIQLADKENSFNEMQRNMNECINKLKVENKQLRDKVILLQTRQTQQAREQRYQQSYAQYDKPLQMQPLTQNRQLMDRNRSRYGRQ